MLGHILGSLQARLFVQLSHCSTVASSLLYRSSWLGLDRVSSLVVGIEDSKYYLPWWYIDRCVIITSPSGAGLRRGCSHVDPLLLSLSLLPLCNGNIVVASFYCLITSQVGIYKTVPLRQPRAFDLQKTNVLRTLIREVHCCLKLRTGISHCNVLCWSLSPCAPWPRSCWTPPPQKSDIVFKSWCWLICFNNNKIIFWLHYTTYNITII